MRATLLSLAVLTAASSAQAAVVMSANFNDASYQGFFASTFDIGGGLNKGNPTVAGDHAMPIYFKNSNNSQFFAYYTNPTVLLQAGDIVTLTYDAKSDFWDGFSRATDFRAKIMAGGNELAGQDNLFAVYSTNTGPTVQHNETQYYTYSLSYVVPSSGAMIGQNVYPQFDAYGARGGWTGADWFERTLLDNVSLSVVSVPEPTSLLTISAGAMVMLKRRARLA
jgi:hypothetical protein